MSMVLNVGVVLGVEGRGRLTGGGLANRRMVFVREDREAR